MDGLNSCDSVEQMMAFLTATINVLTIDQLVQMVANLNHNRYIDTFPDGRLEQRAANLTAAIQMYERGGDPCPRVNQLERENVRLRDVNQMLNNKYGIFEHTYMVVPDPEQEFPALDNSSDHTFLVVPHPEQGLPPTPFTDAHEYLLSLGFTLRDAHAPTR
jgi:hypothetical protein